LERSRDSCPFERVLKAAAKVYFAYCGGDMGLQVLVAHVFVVFF
jgi:hypothetical protein